MATVVARDSCVRYGCTRGWNRLALTKGEAHARGGRQPFVADELTGNLDCLSGE